MDEVFKPLAGPHPVDQLIGHQIRTIRLRRGLSQLGLAERIGVTFQQVQKYEKGINRVAGSRLYHIASILNVSVTAFYDGLPDPTTSSGDITTEPGIVPTALPDATSVRLTEALAALPPRLRKASCALIIAMAGLPQRSDESEEKASVGKG